MNRLPVAAAACLLACTVHAQEDAGPPPQAAAAQPGGSPRWEGAIGPIFGWSPAYQGGPGRQLKVTPGFFLRYGRWTVTNTSGFVTRRADDVVRGVAVDMANSERLRINLAARFDNGRREHDAPELQGLGDVKRTVRARLQAQWRLDDGWRAGTALSMDVLGRGGGMVGDVSFGREVKLGAHTVGSWGTSVTLGSARFMQTWFGVDEAQAARSGYPAFRPGAGVRDVSFGVGMRSELSPRWVMIAGASASRLLGAAAASPLTRQRTGWGMSGGIAWRF